jgi:WD40 repeat protein/uncharacterized protein YjbI with pentapeptide repeats
MSSVFLSYSHRDEAWKDRLQTHLGVLEAQGLLDVWNDRRIAAGADWHSEIAAAIDRATVAVLLLSADFLTSPFILSEEVPRFLKRRVTQGLTVLPVVVRSCAWQEVAWLREMLARPLDGHPLAGFHGDRREQELANIAREILRHLRSDIPATRKDPLDRRDDFLSRVQALCSHHEPGAIIERFSTQGTAGSYLRVTRMRGMIRDVFPVGAVEHGLSRQDLQSFVVAIDETYRRHDAGLISTLVYGGDRVAEDLLHDAAAQRVNLVSFVEYQGLIDFRAYLDRQTAKLAGDPIYPPSLYVPQRMRTLSLMGQEDSDHDDSLAQVREWLASPHGRFLVVLGDFGTGKTFLLHELARRMGEDDGGLVPILLQMRSLEKGRTLDALLAQHFAQEGMEGFSPARFRYMLEQGRIALLFDGFDELALRVTYAKAADHFATLLQSATGSAKVVLTSRRQHFFSDNQVKTALAARVESVAGHRLAILQGFDRKQIHRFLINLFKGDERQAAARLDLIDRVKDLLGLSSNPRLLGFIAELPEEQLLAAGATAGEITAAKLYELLLTRWLEYEFDRIHPRGAPPGLSVAERWQAVTLLAMRLWQKTERFVSLSDLNVEAARVVTAVGPAAPDSEVAAFQVGSGTLLVRDDEGNFSFLHQSILEWLVAKNAADDIAAGTAPAALAAREISLLMADFFSSLAGWERAIAWARGALRSGDGDTAKKNALLVMERHKENRDRFALAGQDLRNWDLSGQDLTGEDLSGADLSGADLTSARLVGANLADTKLANATLRDAHLDAAVLTAADLTGADLTGASLLGADLQAANLTGAALRRTGMLKAQVTPGALATADVRGAALDPAELWPGGDLPILYQDVAWSSDGTLLAIAAGSSVILWDVPAWRPLRLLKGHRAPVWSVAFSRHGNILASGSEDRTIRVWDLASCREIGALTGHGGGVNCVAFSPNGSLLASGSEDHTVRIWDVAGSREVLAFTGHRGPVLCVAFRPNGKTVASAAPGKAVLLWQTDSGRQVREIDGHAGAPWSVAFSPDGKTLATADDYAIRLWQVDSGRKIRTLHTVATGRPIRVAFSPDGTALAGCQDNSLRLWQLETGHEIETLRGEASRVVAFSPDGKSIASISRTSASLWRPGSGTATEILPGSIRAVVDLAFSPDGTRLVSAVWHQGIRVWELHSGQALSHLVLGDMNAVALSPDGSTLASTAADQTVALWSIGLGRKMFTLPDSRGIIGLAFSPDGKMLAGAGRERPIRLWNVPRGQIAGGLAGSSESTVALAFDARGELLASCTDRLVSVWDLRARVEGVRLDGPTDTITSVVFSPDSRTLACGSWDSKIYCWYASYGALKVRHLLRSLSGHTDGVLSLAFSPDGRTLASGSADATVRLWRTRTGKVVEVLQHEGRVWSLQFSRDGKQLVCGCDSGTIHLWDLVRRRRLAVLMPLPDGWVAHAPDGRYKFGGRTEGGFWHVANLRRFEVGELDDWLPGLRLPLDASFFDLPCWRPEERTPAR